MGVRYFRGLPSQSHFFCIGKNVTEHPDIFNDIINRGHRIGNYTNNHLNLWKTTSKYYKEDIEKADEILNLNIEYFFIEKDNLPQSSVQKLFRPPYGKLKPKMVKCLLKKIIKS